MNVHVLGDHSVCRLLRYSCNDDVDGAGDAVDADDDDAVNPSTLLIN